MAVEDIEIKPSFSVRYFGLTLTVGLMTGLLGFFSSYAVELFKTRKKVVGAEITSSPNLAALPKSDANNIQVYFETSPGQKEPIRSLFRCDVTISNRSDLGMDDFQSFSRYQTQQRSQARR